MRILPNQVFLDEEDRYEPDQVYEVSDEKGYYFCAVGWAESVDSDYVATGENTGEVVTLDIHNATVGLKDSNG